MIVEDCWLRLIFHHPLGTCVKGWSILIKSFTHGMSHQSRWGASPAHTWLLVNHLFERLNWASLITHLRPLTIETLWAFESCLARRILADLWLHHLNRSLCLILVHLLLIPIPCGIIPNDHRYARVFWGCMRTHLLLILTNLIEVVGFRRHRLDWGGIHYHISCWSMMVLHVDDLFSDSWLIWNHRYWLFRRILEIFSTSIGSRWQIFISYTKSWRTFRAFYYHNRH